MPFVFPEDETFDVGVDTRTPIDDRDYQVPFRFTGKLVKLTVEMKPISGTLGQILEPESGVKRPLIGAASRFGRQRGSRRPGRESSGAISGPDDSPCA